MSTGSLQKPIVLHIVYSGFGGIASVFFSLVEASKDDNYEHVVAWYGVEDLVDDYREHCEHLGITQRFFRRRPRIDFYVNRALNKWVSDLAPVAIIVNLPRALKPAFEHIKKNPEVKVVGVEHHPNALKRVIDWRDSARFSRYCTDVVFLTGAYRDQVEKRLGKMFDSKKSVIIPNGINTEKFKPVAKVSNNNVDSKHTDNTIRIGMASRLSDSKDIITLVRSMAAVRNTIGESGVILSIAGDGPEMENLTHEVQKLDLGRVVDFQGFLGESELVEWLQSLDIYAHATLAETMSTSIMQGLATGLPCVVSELPGMDELVVPGTGFIVEPKNDKQLSDALLRLCLDVGLRADMGSSARHHAVTQLSQSVSWQRYKHVIEN